MAWCVVWCRVWLCAPCGVVVYHAVIAEALKVNGALTKVLAFHSQKYHEGTLEVLTACAACGAQLNLKSNDLGDEARAALLKVAEGRPSLTLEL